MGSQRVGHDWATELNWLMNSSWYILSDELSNMCKFFIKDALVAWCCCLFDILFIRMARKLEKKSSLAYYFPGGRSRSHSDQPQENFQGYDEKSCHCLLLTVNQTSSETECFQVCYLVQSKRWILMVPHNSKDTEMLLLSTRTAQGPPCSNLSAWPSTTGQQRNQKFHRQVLLSRTSAPLLKAHSPR